VFYRAAMPTQIFYSDLEKENFLQSSFSGHVTRGTVERNCELGPFLGCQPYASAALYPQKDFWYSFLLEAMVDWKDLVN
jgi:hypothetical protein